MQPLRVWELAGVGFLFVVGCSGKASSTDAAGGMDAGGTSSVPTAGTGGVAGISHTGGVGGVAGIGHTGGVGGVAAAPVNADGCPLSPFQADGAACVAPTKACGRPPLCTGVNAPNHIVSGSVINCYQGRWVRDGTERVCDCNAPELKDTAECDGGGGAGGEGGVSQGGAAGAP